MWYILLSFLIVSLVVNFVLVSTIVNMIKDIKKFKRECDCTRGLYCFDKNPIGQPNGWIAQNMFQLE